MAKDDSVGKKEGFYHLSSEIDDFLDIQNNEMVETLDELEEFHTDSTDSLDWTPERERRMSYECFKFPERNEDFDEELEHRFILATLKMDDAAAAAEKNKIKKEGCTVKVGCGDGGLSFGSPATSIDDNASELISCSEAEELLTKFDHMHHQSVQDTWLQLGWPKVSKTICNAPPVYVRNPPAADATTPPRPATTATTTAHLLKTDKQQQHQQQQQKKRTIGKYAPEERRERIAKYLEKRKRRVWRKHIKYSCRKKLADGRPRIRGRFVKQATAAAAAASATTVVEEPELSDTVLSSLPASSTVQTRHHLSKLRHR